MKLPEHEEKKIIFQDFTVFYYLYGNPNKPVMLYLHPAFANHQIFYKQYQEFENDYYMLALDMVGHGKSQNFKSKINMSHMPEIIYRILEKELMPQVHVIGVSLGSLVAQGFADKYPTFVSSVTVVGGYSIHHSYDDLLKVQQKEIFKWLFYLLFSPEKFKKYIIKSSCYSKEAVEMFELSFQNFKRRQFISMNGMNTLFHKIDHIVTYPLLIVHGEHDLPIVLESNQTWNQIEMGSHLVKVPNAGHCANIDNPTFFNQELNSFLNS